MLRKQYARQQQELRRERARRRVKEKQVAEWRGKYFDEHDEAEKLSREVRKLGAIPASERRRLRREAEEELERARAEIEALNEHYETTENELDAKIRAAMEKYSQASEDAEKAETVLGELKSAIKEWMIDSMHEAEARRRWRTAVWSFILGVVSSLIASAIIILATGIST